MKGLILSILVLVFALNVECSNKQIIEDDQNWYKQDQKDQNKDHQKYQQLKKNTSRQQKHQNRQNTYENSNYERLLQIQRQILMSQQMIQLYTQRLKLLFQIKEQVKRNIQFLENKPYQVDQDQNQQTQNEKTQLKQTQQPKSRPQNKKYIKNNQVYLKIDQFQIISALQNNQKQGKASQQKNIDILKNSFKNIILVPPFLINIEHSYVTLIQKNHQLSSQNAYSNSHKQIYKFGTTSNRLLFYSNQQIKKQQFQNIPKHHFILTLTLQIKPNKIKIVKINFRPTLIQINSTNQDLTKIWEVQEQITSYESHQLINHNFKWHNALDFDNLIIGFNNQTILIKSKDKKIHQINIGSKILSIQSINQFKIYFIAQRKIGTLNVRSFLITQEIQFQYYLGNRTIMKQKQLDKQKSENSPTQSNNIQNDELYAQFDSDKEYIWHSPFSRKYSQIYSIAQFYMKKSRLNIILLSNGDLLTYQKDRITSHTNLGSQLSKQLNLHEIYRRFQSLTQQEKNSINTHFHIRIEVLDSFNHLLITSNMHSQILIYNISIPGLSNTRSDESSWFSTSNKAKQFKSKQWMPVQISTNRENSKLCIHEYEIFVNDWKHIQLQREKDLGSNIKSKNEISLLLYHHTSQISQTKKDFTHRIQKYRILLDLVGNSPSSGLFQSDRNNTGPSQTKSYLWNILMVFIIISGVLIFRKWNSKNNNSENLKPYEQQYLANKNIGKQKKQYKQQINFNQKKNIRQKRQDPNKKSQNINQTSQNVISQLQKQLQKQGQKLSKNQIIQIMRQMEEQQEFQSSKPQMQRENPQVNNQKQGDPKINKNNLQQNMNKSNDNLNKNERKNSSQETLKLKGASKHKKQ